MPVVPGSHGRHRQIPVLGHLLQPLAGEPRKERREVQRRVYPVEIHVFDALVNVPSATPHLVEPGRFETVLGHRPADHGVEADVGQRLSVIHPGLPAVPGVDHLRGAFGELARHAAGEGVRWLDDVIVDRDHGVEPFGPFGFREEGHRPFGTLVRGGEVEIAGELIDGLHGQSPFRSARPGRP